MSTPIEVLQISDDAGSVLQAGRQAVISLPKIKALDVRVTALENAEPSSGMPTGYGPEAWTVYDDGVVTTRNFLTDNPD